MKTIAVRAGLWALLLLGVLVAGCTQTGQPTTSVTPTTVCAAIAAAQANPTFTTALAPQVAANTALGQVWQYAQSGCVGSAPLAGVNASWTAEMLAFVEQALPAVLPALVGLI